ncbi:MAG: ATPase P [Thalassobius sp.]|nr:ATPase P [Thalassovita sp.]
MEKLKNAYQLESDEVISSLKTDPDQGLSSSEAESRLNEFGRNKLKEEKKKSLFQILIDQLNNPVIYLLLAAVTLSFVFGDIAEAIAIIVVIVLNTVIGFWMELQAMQSMDALQKMDKLVVNIIRDGQEKQIDAEELVPGDLLAVEAGDLIPADCRIIYNAQLKVDESPLTGESIPVDKTTEKIEGDTGIGDRKNTLYKGTAVTNGNGKAIVVNTGMETELGNISQMVSDAGSEEVPLNKKLEKLSKHLIWATLGLAAVFFVVGWISGEDPYELVQTSIAWTIAAIPEGLPIVASIALARGMLKLAKQNVIVKKLSAVETLGETTVIFTDKTGTLTLNQLSVNAVMSPEKDYDVTNGKNGYSDDENVKKMLSIAVLCNNANIENSNGHNGSDNGHDGDGEEKEKADGVGDPIEIASLLYTKNADEGRYQELIKAEKILEDPFDSDKMMMGTAHVVNDGKVMVSAKGATEKLLRECNRILAQGKEEALSEEQKQEWIDKNNELSEDGLRILAFAYKDMDNKPSSEDELLNDLTFAGLIGYIDPPRESVKDAIDTCHKAGIEVIMLTGDHPGTAKNIATQVHLVDKDDTNVVHGEELSDNTDEHTIVESKVFSRVDPSQKLAIIEAYQKEGHIVGMTGDGVNDAPALKKADIGIAMGDKGTQVAQEVADMVLKDDSFESIVTAIKQGRVIFSNIRKFIIYQLSYHLSEIIVIASVSFSLFFLPLLPLQLLFLNLISDVFPALALGIGQGNPHVMNNRPNSKQEPIITKEKWIAIVVYAVVLALCVGGAYFFSYFNWDAGEEISNNVAFFTLAFSQLLHVLNMRDADENIFVNQVTKNKFIWMALAFCFACMGAAYFIPQLAEILSIQELEAKYWGLIATMSVMPIAIIQLLKAVTKKL